LILNSLRSSLGVTASRPTRSFLSTCLAFHYLMKQTGTHCDSEGFVDHPVQKVQGDTGFQKRARDSYKSKA